MPYLGYVEWLLAPRLYVVAEAVVLLGVGWLVRDARAEFADAVV